MAVGPCLVVAGLSVRALAQAAQRDGFEVLALDLFGDADTRAASAEWWPIGDAEAMRIDAGRFLDALRHCAASHGTRGGAIGWVCGSGFEGQIDLVSAGAERLPLLGCGAAAVAATRDPRRFFALLDAYGMPHPEVAFAPPTEAEGWLRKDARASGGWHIRQARADDATEPGHYWQRSAPGRPMSMTLLAAHPKAGVPALVLGVNEQIVERFQGRPHVFRGVIGPVHLPGRLPTALQGMAERLAADFGLCGLCGVDFMLDGEQILLLELNPRPPASAALYGRQGGLMAAHVEACTQGHLPGGEALAALRPDIPSGLRHVFARRSLNLGESHLARLAARPDVHDRPGQPMKVTAGEPLCTLGAEGDDAETLRSRLAAADHALWTELETME